MTTFSQLVDEIASETKRPDLLAEIAVYLNQTIREVHFEPSRGNVAFYANNRREVQLTATSETGEIWDIPTPSAFQAIEAVRYPSNYLGRLEFAQLINPGPRAVSVPFYYYRSGASYVFGGAEGYGGIGGLIQISYFEYPRALKYKTLGLREAQWDVDDGFAYADLYSGSPELQATARERVTNWLLERWADVLREGLRAKIYKRLSDEPRARTCYSLYSQLRQGLYTSEVAELSGVF